MEEKIERWGEGNYVGSMANITDLAILFKHGYFITLLRRDLPNTMKRGLKIVEIF